MPINKKSSEGIDWNLTTWEGSHRETLRRWADLPLECVIAALEEMQELSDMLSQSPIGTSLGRHTHRHEPDKM